MPTVIVPAGVRSKLGANASEELVEMFTAYHELATDRYERRLIEEIAALRVELHQGLAGLRQEIAGIRADLLKWSLLFWVGQFTAVLAALAFLLDGR